MNYVNHDKVKVSNCIKVLKPFLNLQKKLKLCY